MCDELGRKRVSGSDWRILRRLAVFTAMSCSVLVLTMVGRQTESVLSTPNNCFFVLSPQSCHFFSIVFYKQTESD